MCLKLFWSKNSSRDGGRDFSPPKKNKVFNKPPSGGRDDIEKETSAYNPNYPYNETPPKSDYVPSPPPTATSPPPPQKKPHSKLPRPLVSEETYYPTKGGGGGGGYVDEDSKSDAAYKVSESTTLKGLHGVFG